MNNNVTITEAPVTIEINDTYNTVAVVATSAIAVEVATTGPQGPPGEAASLLRELKDVDVGGRANGSILYFDGLRDKFVADSIETKINLTDGGNF